MPRNLLRDLLTAALTAFPATGAAATFDDIQFWAGSGANRAALVIDWDDGRPAESLLWGFRWDGTATGLDMLQAVVNADPRLFAHLGNYGWGTATLGLGYDLNASGSFAVSPGLAFDAGGLAVDTNPDDARVSVDAGDHWLEGWNNGFWAYYLKSPASENWTSATSGAADRALVDGGWDGFVFAPGFVSGEPAAPVPAAVPEPGAGVLLSLGACALLWPRRRQA